MAPTDNCSNPPSKTRIEKLIGTLEGVHVEPLDLELDFVDLAGKFAHLPGTVALVSGGDGDCARYHLLGVRPWLTLTGRPGSASLTVDGRQMETDQAPFDLLDTVLKCLQLPHGIWPAPMAAGLMGYLAYDLKDELEKVPRTSVDDVNLPTMVLYAPSVVVVHDRHTKAARLLIPQRVESPQRTTELVNDFFQLAKAPVAGQPRATFKVSSGLTSNFTASGYRAAVQRVVDYIVAGDIYQANLSQRFQTTFDGDGFDLFHRLFKVNPAAFFAYIRADDHQIVSTSPERFLQRNGTYVETRPIKGTRPRGQTLAEDEKMREELLNSSKDDAELSMIVDLLRNDLGKVCDAGSVHVLQHKRLEAYENVYHLVSIVEGELEAHRSSVDLIRATFPGGSITGCPKVRAMEIIDELESCRRHVYCGSIGYISFHDTMDLSIAIRTATLVGDTMRYSAGGGIVFDSDARAEYEETLHKGRTLANVCREKQTTHQQDDTIVWFNGHLMPMADARLPVADQGVQYGYGFFETMRAYKGTIGLLCDHLDRFNATWRELFAFPPPDLSWEVIVEQVLDANGLNDATAAVKLLVTRGSRTKPPWDYNLLVTARPYRHRLAASHPMGLTLGTYPYPRQSPLAGHKTLNYLYYLRAGQWAVENGFNEALVLNPDGSISETNTTNLLLIDGREVIRPTSPAVLPGVAAAAICRQLAAWDFRITERAVVPKELHSVPILLATNALMGAVPVVEIDGLSRPGNGGLWERLNDELMQGWRVGLSIR